MATHDEGEAKANTTRPGRPRIYHESRRKITVMLPETDLAAIEASGVTLTEFIVTAVREKLERESHE